LIKGLRYCFCVVGRRDFNAMRIETLGQLAHLIAPISQYGQEAVFLLEVLVEPRLAGVEELGGSLCG
jgi:hypothetical protein